jgi:hypothetical protein
MDSILYSIGHRLTRIKKKIIFACGEKSLLHSGAFIFQDSVPPSGGLNLSELTSPQAK